MRRKPDPNRTASEVSELRVVPTRATGGLVLVGSVSISSFRGRGAAVVGLCTEYYTH